MKTQSNPTLHYVHLFPLFQKTQKISGILKRYSSLFDLSLGPAAAVLKVFYAVHGLEKLLLSDPRSDLPGYLSVVKRLEEALRFLGDNCGLAIQWLEDIVEYLEDNAVADERYLSNLKKSLKSLRELQSDEGKTYLDGGLLEAALGKLENLRFIICRWV